MTVDPDSPDPQAPRPSHGHDHTGAEQAARALQSQLRAARSELENQVAHARENFEETNERIKQRTGRDLILAIVIGVVVGGLALGSLLFLKVLFIPVAVAAAIAATIELVRALQAGGHRVDIVPQLLVSATIIGSAYFVDLWVLWSLLFVGVVVIAVWRLIGQMAARDGRRHGDVLSDVLVGGFVPIYVSFLAAASLVLLSRQDGQYWVILFLGVAIAADTGAYAIGLWLGKHPLAPRVSPKKTWEGFGGAALFAVVVATLLCTLMLQLPWWTGPIVGIVILCAATLGDLGESLVKRDLGIKDMSSWFPGHGGLLDRLDSLLPSAVATLVLYQFLSPLVAP